MSRRAGAGPPSGPPRLEHVLAVGLRSLNIGTNGVTPPPGAKRKEPGTPGKREGPSGSQSSRSDDTEAVDELDLDGFRREVLAAGMKTGKKAKSKAVVRAFRNLMREKSTGCQFPIISYYRGVRELCLMECPGGDLRKRPQKRGGGFGLEPDGAPRPCDFPVFSAEHYVVLATASGCVLSVVGLDTNEGDDRLEVLLTTPQSQQGKGYNSLLLAACVLLAWAQGVDIKAAIANQVTTYMIARRFHGEADYGNGVTTTTPMSREEAIRLADSGEVVEMTILASEANFAVATQVAFESALMCAETERRKVLRPKAS